MLDERLEEYPRGYLRKYLEKKIKGDYYSPPQKGLYLRRFLEGLLKI
jgi:hypothetical protein